MGKDSLKKINQIPLSQDVYTRDYFLHKRLGADEFTESGGRILSPIHARILEYAAPAPGKKIMDVGCGCGEIVIHAALHGAYAVGVDYAKAAHEIAVETASNLGANAKFYLGDINSLPDESFDAVILSDIIEHLYPVQLQKLYADIYTRLNPEGRLIIHTWPNKWHTEYAYPIARFLLGVVGIKKPRSPRKPHDEIMHINEQSIFSLWYNLQKAGYRSKIWLEHLMPDNAGFIYKFTHTVMPIKLFFADHIFAICWKKEPV